ncbi:MAG: hypothetical protein M9932_10780 [Xanthobacteraceae bacterium]|nr:hypothetical protein [Xanthobacteraceae bacterium]
MPHPTQTPSSSSTAAIDPQPLATEMAEVMAALFNVVERETDLMRAGRVSDAMALEAGKTSLSRRYVNLISALKANGPRLRAVAPDLLTALQRQHETFRAMLQVNLTVLATAHAVSEGVVRGVNSEVQRRNMPQTYTASGQRAAPGPRHAAPLAISRTL